MILVLFKTMQMVLKSKTRWTRWSCFSLSTTFEKISSSFAYTIVSYKHIFREDWTSEWCNWIYFWWAVLVKHCTRVRLKLPCEMEFDDTKAKTIASRSYPSPSFAIAHSNFIKSVICDAQKYTFKRKKGISNTRVDSTVQNTRWRWWKALQRIKETL